MVIFHQMDMDRDIRVTADQAISRSDQDILQIMDRHRQWVVHIQANLADIPDFVDIIQVFQGFLARADTQEPNFLEHQQQDQLHNMLQLKPLRPLLLLPELKANKDNRDRRFHIILVILVCHQMVIQATLVCVRDSHLDLVMDQCLHME